MTEHGAPCFVYLAYDLLGRYAWIYDQLTYSVLSLLGCEDGSDLWQPRIRVFVDEPERLAPIHDVVQLHRLTKDRILQGMSHHRFLHRLKLDLLVEVAEQESEPLVFLDCDTRLIKPFSPNLQSLVPGSSLMHVREGLVGKPQTGDQRRLLAFLNNLDKHSIRVPRETVMYNSGVIGLAPDDFHLLREALQWTDDALPFGQPHTLEQLALSLSLGKDTDVRTVDDTVHHYWNQRPQYNAAISQLLSEIRDRKMSPASAVQYVVEHVPQVPPFCKPGLLARLWQKVIGRTAFSTLRIKEEIERTYRVDR